MRLLHALGRWLCGISSTEYVPRTRRPVPYDLQVFWTDLAAWSSVAFGDDKIRGPIGPLKHLAKEVEECLADPTDLEEYADLLFLVFDATRRAGFTYFDFVNAVRTKLRKNMARKWPSAKKDEPVEHEKP